MKTIIVCLFLFPLFAYSQVKIDGVDINRLPEVKYIEVEVKGRSFIRGVTIVIDYGQEMKPGSDQKIEKEDGKPILFNSKMAALNFLESNGWTYVDNFVDTSGGYYRYLLKRKE